MDAAWPDYPDAPSRLPLPPGAARSPNHTPEYRPFGDDGLTFADVLDVVNPLQHIPVVSTLYRTFTGDEIAPASRILGGALFGGVIGAIGAVVNVIVNGLTGRDVGEHVLAIVQGKGAEGHDAGAITPAYARLSPAFDMPFYDASALDPNKSLIEAQPWARRLLAERADAARAAEADTGITITRGGPPDVSSDPATAAGTSTAALQPPPRLAAAPETALNPAFDMPFYDSSAIDPGKTLPEVQGWARRMMAERLALAAEHALATGRYGETAANTAGGASDRTRIDVQS